MPLLHFSIWNPDSVKYRKNPAGFFLHRMDTVVLSSHASLFGREDLYKKENAMVFWNAVSDGSVCRQLQSNRLYFLRGYALLLPAMFSGTVTVNMDSELQGKLARTCCFSATEMPERIFKFLIFIFIFIFHPFFLAALEKLPRALSVKFLWFRFCIQRAG